MPADDIESTSKSYHSNTALPPDLLVLFSFLLAGTARLAERLLGHLAPSILASWRGSCWRSFLLIVLTSLKYYAESRNHVV